MKYTHQKRPYRAVAVQWTEHNTSDILDVLNAQKGMYATPYGDAIILRVDDAPKGHNSIETITPGWWVVFGENRRVKVYTDTQFWTKYEKAQ